jgi:hypothetical protein
MQRFRWIVQNVIIPFSFVAVLDIPPLSFISQATPKQVLILKLLIWIPALAMPMLDPHFVFAYPLHAVGTKMALLCE